MSRKVARDTAMKLAFEWSVSGGSEESLRELFDDVCLTDSDKDYVRDVVDGIKDHIDEIDEYISECSIGWKTDRMAKVDLAITRLAIYEILYREEIPQSVSINEAVELAKQYGGDKSASFLNGILGKFIRSREMQK